MAGGGQVLNQSKGKPWALQTLFRTFNITAHMGISICVQNIEVNGGVTHRWRSLGPWASLSRPGLATLGAGKFRVQARLYPIRGILGAALSHACLSDSILFIIYPSGSQLWLLWNHLEGFKVLMPGPTESRPPDVEGSPQCFLKISG